MPKAPKGSTAPSDDGALLLRSLAPSRAGPQAGGGRHVLWTLHLLKPQRVPWGLLPFLNGGRGEEVLRWGGPFEYAEMSEAGRDGAAIRRGWCRPLRGALDYFRGLESAEECVGTELDHRVRYRCHPGGALEIWGPGSEVVTSTSTGWRVLMRFESRLWVFPDGSVSARSENAVTEWHEF